MADPRDANAGELLLDPIIMRVSASVNQLEVMFGANNLILPEAAPPPQLEAADDFFFLPTSSISIQGLP